MNISTVERIEQLRGMEEFKSLAQRLQMVAKNKKELPMSRIQLPHYLFLAAPGCGVTTHIRMFADLVSELRLAPFEGDRRCFEWALDEKAFAEGGAFERLLDEIVAMAGFHSSFKGIIGVEIDAWAERADSGELTRLLNLADDCLGQIVFVFVAQMEKDSEHKELIRRISAEVPLEVVRFPMPSADDMALYLSDFLLRRRFRVSMSTLEQIRAMMPKLIDTDAFDGFQTLDNLADEIIYRFCTSADRNGSAVIEPEDIAFITGKGGYIERLGTRLSRNKKKAIGFRSGGEQA